MTLFVLGDPEPAIIPTANSLRLLKSRKIASNRRNEDTFISLAMMKKESEFKNVLHSMGYEPFYIHYHSAEQIAIYRSYCQITKNPKIVIDATGSVIKSFSKCGIEENKTKPLLLYEALVYDAQKHQNFTVTNMISESHTNISISNWLQNWLNCDIPKPKEAVCDHSIALLSALVKSFTQYSTLQDYLRACARLLTENEFDYHAIPRCFIRIDVAHFIKIASKWTPLKSITRLAREMILRAIGLLIKCKTLNEIRVLLLSLFVLLTNETNGTDIENGEETPCEQHKRLLTEATSTGFVDEIILFLGETQDDARTLLENDYERQNEALDSHENPFQTWADAIFIESKKLIKDGTGINPLYCPELVSVLIKTMKYIPLWSGVMIPIFNYGEDISSSAAVESSFKKLKNITMKHVTLPTNIEIFLENHIQVLKGSSMIRSAKNKIHHSPLVHNDINSTPQITTCEVLEGDTDTIDNEDEFCNEIKNHGDVIHTSDDTQNIMVDDVLIGKLNDEISEEIIIESKTYPSSNVGMYNIYFKNFK